MASNAATLIFKISFANNHCHFPPHDVLSPGYPTGEPLWLKDFFTSRFFWDWLAFIDRAFRLEGILQFSQMMSVKLRRCLAIPPFSCGGGNTLLVFFQGFPSIQ